MMRGRLDAKGAQLSQAVAGELRVEAQREMRREREARGFIRQAARLDALVQRANRAVRIDLHDDDGALHELHRRLAAPRSSAASPPRPLERRANASSVVDGWIGPMPDEPVIVMCGGSSPAMRGSNRRWSSSTRSASAPRSSDITMMPGFMAPPRSTRRVFRKAMLGACVRKRNARVAGMIEKATCPVAGVQAVLSSHWSGVVGVDMRIAHHLHAGEGPDRRAHDDVARPMTIVVHPRQTDSGRAAVQHRTDEEVRRAGPARARFRGHRRRRSERRGGVSRRKRLIVIAAIPAATSCQLLGFGHVVSTNGRARPKKSFITVPAAAPSKSASVPCRPTSASRSCW